MSTTPLVTNRHCGRSIGRITRLARASVRLCVNNRYPSNSTTK